MNRRVTTFFRFTFALAIGFVCVSARADNVELFNFSGTLIAPINFNTSVTGSFALDTTNGTITAFSFTTPVTQINTTNGWFAGVFAYTPASSPSADFVGLVFTDPVGDNLDLLFETTLSAFSGNTFYTGVVQPTSGPGNVSRLDCVSFTFQNQTFCSAFVASGFTSGNATPVPELSSMLLFGTGLATIAGSVGCKLGCLISS